MHKLGRMEVQSAVNVGHGKGIRAVAAELNIADKERPTCGPVRFPEFAAVLAVVGREEKLAIDVDQQRRQSVGDPRRLLQNSGLR